MNAKQLMDAVGSIDGKYVEQYADTGAAGTAKQSPRKFRFVRAAWAAAAACLILAVAAVSFIGVKARAEEKEYREALTFFDENGLSDEGLTKKEVIAVYRDITTESFTYGKTAQVIAHNISVSGVGGSEFIVDSELLDYISVKELWETANTEHAPDGIWYKTGLNYLIHDDEGGWYEETGSFIEKRDGEKLVWRRDYDGRFIGSFTENGDKLLLCELLYDAAYDRHTRFVLLDSDGNTLWDLPFSDKDEMVCTVLAEDDGGFAVFSRYELNSFVFTRLDSDGNTVLRTVTETGNKGVGKAAHYRDGYIVQLFSWSSHEIAAFAKVDGSGNITDFYNYTAENELYYLNDLIEYGGRIYLSVYVVPKNKSHANNNDPYGIYYTPHYELSDVLEYCFECTSRENSYDEERGQFIIPELTERVRENYTAMLLLLEPEEGMPTEFYSVRGAVGGSLSVKDGELVWNAEDIRYTYFSPATNSFTIGGLCKLIEYRFDANGGMISSRDTGEFTGFRR